MRTHLTPGGCGRGQGRFLTENPFDVDCGVCAAKPAYSRLLAEAKQEREAAFQAQEPRTIVPQFGRVNDDGVMECYACKGVLFRERPRSLFSYHYVCAACGTSMHPMTETGMST